MDLKEKKKKTLISFIFAKAITCDINVEPKFCKKLMVS